MTRTEAARWLRTASFQLTYAMDGWWDTGFELRLRLMRLGGRLAEAVIGSGGVGVLSVVRIGDRRDRRTRLLCLFARRLAREVE